MMVETTPLTAAAANDLGYTYDASGNITIVAPEAPNPASVLVAAGNSTDTDVNGGALVLSAGNANIGNGDGGDVLIGLGLGAGAGSVGFLKILGGLPSVDPHVYGAIWSDAGALKISSG
jgi:hypothetical protein